MPLAPKEIWVAKAILLALLGFALGRVLTLWGMLSRMYKLSGEMHNRHAYLQIKGLWAPLKDAIFTWWGVCAFLAIGLLAVFLKYG